MATISRLYDTYEAAAEAMRNLMDAGIPHSDISLVSNNSDNWYSTTSARGAGPVTGTVDRDRDGRDDRVEGAEAGAGIGGVAGGIIGLLTGLGLMAIPVARARNAPRERPSHRPPARNTPRAGR